MTISTTIIKNSYSGDASTVTFAYQFKISTTADMEVIIRTAAGAETVKTLTTHYTVTGAGTASGGNVVFESGHVPSGTETVILRRSTTQTQALDLVENDPFTADSVESAFDKNLALIQELQEESTRAIKLSKSNTMTSTEFTVAAAARASKVLAFDSNGELSVTQELGTYQGTSATTTTAAHVIRDLVKGSTAAQLNNIYICIQASPIGTALTNTSYWVLIVNAVAAATSATAAATSATASAASAVDATNNGAAKVTLAAAQVTLATAQVALGTTQANNSATSATASASSATAGASSATAAASSATAAAASFDAFDDIYLGAKSSAPSVDNDGDALTTGDQYFNTSANQLNIWNGSAWQVAAISASGLATIVGTETLTNKTLTSPKINEDVAVTSTATELNLLDGKAATNLALLGKTGGTNFTNSLLVGHATTGTLSSADQNTGVGIISLDALTSGDENTAVGYNAGSAITTSKKNTAVGSSALAVQTTGDSTNGYNTAFGRSALQLTTGQYNTGLGGGAGENITSADGCVIIGKVTADSATADKQLKIAGYDGSTTTTWISGNSSGVVTLNAANVTQQALSSSSNAVAWDASAKPNAYHLTTENTTFSAPSNPIEGAFICVEINYNGSHTIAFNTVFEFAASTAPTFTSTDAKTDIMVFKYSGAVWQEVGRTLNLSEA